MGLVVYLVLMVSGLTILALLFFVPALFDPSGNELEAMGIGALLALPPLVVYLWLPWIIDRYDPEPWWCLALALGWGVGFTACLLGLGASYRFDLPYGPTLVLALGVFFLGAVVLRALSRRPAGKGA